MVLLQRKRAMNEFSPLNPSSPPAKYTDIRGHVYDASPINPNLILDIRGKPLGEIDIRDNLRNSQGDIIAKLFPLPQKGN
jgi:hypothetical protein